MGFRGWVRRCVVAGVALVALAPFAPSPSEAAVWAPIESAAIRPGNSSVTGSNQCTTNFVFTHGNDVLIGYAAHCAGLDDASMTNGCKARSMPLGTKVQVDGADEPGTLVYSSWLAMQAVNEPNTQACANQDFALVRLHPSDAAKVNPTVPHWGGPHGVDANGTRPGEKVFTYGNSSLRLGLNPFKPKRGPSQGSQAGGWGHRVLTLTPGIPGDSGSGFMDYNGKAFGVLSTMQTYPRTFTNGVADLHFAMIYARAHGMPQLQLANGTRTFTTKGNVP